MKSKRRGITLLETTIMVGLVTFVAGLSINIVRLGNRNFEHVRDDAYDQRQAFRFAVVLRERAHRATRAIVSEPGDELLLSFGESNLTKFLILDEGIEMVVEAAEQIVARELFTLDRDDRAWRFRVDDEKRLIELIGPFQNGLNLEEASERGVIVAAFGLVPSLPSVAGDSDAKEG